MKAQIEQLLTSGNLFQQLVTNKLNGAVAFKILAITKEAEYQLKNFNEARMKIITDNNGKLEEGSGDFTFESDEIKEKAEKEFNELLKSEVDIHARPLTLSDLEKIDEITSQELHVIEWAITE